MTSYGLDNSHYDITPTKRDGIDLYTAKLTDGLHYYEDPTFKAKLEAMRAFGVPVLGAYHVLWGNRDIEQQAIWMLQRLDALIPWWRDVVFIIQSDDEGFGYNGVPSIAQINTFHDMITKHSGVIWERNIPYAPSWEYGNRLTGLAYRWWQSSYGSNPVGYYRDIYPGDGSTRWNGPITTFLLQYGSNATVAGQTTSDANAFRGSTDDLLAALKAGTQPGGVDDMTAVKLNSFPGQPDWTEGAVHVSDNSAQGYHVVARETFTATVWPNMGTLVYGGNVPAKPDVYSYEGILKQLFGPGAPVAGSGSAPASYTIALSGSMSGTATVTQPVTTTPSGE